VPSPPAPPDQAADRDQAAGRRRPFEVVALLASLGGVEAVATVLAALPAGFPGAVIVALHLGGEPAAVSRLITRRAKLPVTWAADGVRIEAGHVYIAPSQAELTVLPDRVFSVVPSSTDYAPSADALLRSLAAAYRDGALVVVLTGMGRAGADGVRAVKELGGTVFAQDEATSMSFGMPGAAIRTGHVDLVLPIGEIGGVIDAVVARGAAVPRPRVEAFASEWIFGRGGHCGALMRRIDWSMTPLGAVETWPRSLCLVAAALLAAGSPMFVCWGPELITLYNDACIPLFGVKHPRAIGQPARACWSETWNDLGPAFEEVLLQDGPVILQSQPLFTVRRGAVEEAYATFSLGPIGDEASAVAGVLVTMTETTTAILQLRRLRTLRDLASRASAAGSALEACVLSAQVIAENPSDVPFALLYLSDLGAGRAHLAGAAGIAAGGPASPSAVELSWPTEAWPIAAVVRKGEPILVRDVVDRFRTLRCEPWGDSPPAALIAPIAPAPGERSIGAVVLGVSPRRELDATYRDFLDLVVAQVALSIVNARSRQALRDRSETLAALDRDKTDFLDTLGRELREPLTLLRGPLDDLLAGKIGEISPAQREAVALARRNALRMLELVDTLLDFSKLQAQRMRASFELLDLASCTRELCAMFREAVERAGVRFLVDCPPLPTQVPVDRAIWEKVVVNLLSNALRATRAGEIEVRLRPVPHHVELCVRDTGAGIPRDDLPHVFDLLHVRTQEISVPGVALVRELVQLHRGQVRVASEVGRGTTFTVWVPQSFAAPRDAQPAPAGAPAAPEPEALPRPRLLLAEGDADLRGYVARLLSDRWTVEAVAGGAAALEAARARPPDLVLSEALLPDLDGRELVRQLRADEGLRAVRVILLASRPGDDLGGEDLARGADDVLFKPFSAQDLVTRVERQHPRRRAAGDPIPTAGSAAR
jgi:signal transduction histidine kinase/CheY-like chemotaxis protein